MGLSSVSCGALIINTRNSNKKSYILFQISQISRNQVGPGTAILNNLSHTGISWGVTAIEGVVIGKVPVVDIDVVLHCPV